MMHNEDAIMAFQTPTIGGLISAPTKGLFGIAEGDTVDQQMVTDATYGGMLAGVVVGTVRARMVENSALSNNPSAKAAIKSKLIGGLI
jgi:hypothetical protein